VLIDAAMPIFDAVIAEHAIVTADPAMTFHAARTLDLLTVRTPLLAASLWIRALPARWVSLSWSTPSTIGSLVGVVAPPRQATTGQMERDATAVVVDPTKIAVPSDTSSLPSTISRALRLNSISASSAGLSVWAVVTRRSLKCPRTACSAEASTASAD
jgi:hypothetical protein